MVLSFCTRTKHVQDIAHFYDQVLVFFLILLLQHAYLDTFFIIHPFYNVRSTYFILSDIIAIKQQQYNACNWLVEYNFIRFFECIVCFLHHSENNSLSDLFLYMEMTYFTYLSVVCRCKYSRLFIKCNQWRTTNLAVL